MNNNCMQPLSQFQTLPQHHQTQVLMYLQLTGSDNIPEAIAILKSHNMNANQAFSHFQFQTQSPHQNPHMASVSNLEPIQYTREQQMEIVRYNSYLRDQYQERASIGYLVRSYKEAVLEIIKQVSQCLIPRCARKKIFYSKFEKMYKDEAKVSFYSKGFDEAFKKGFNDEKCVAVIVSSEHKSSIVSELLSTPNELTHHLNTRMILIGITTPSEQYNKLSVIAETPCIVFTYRTIFGQINVISTITLKQLSFEVVKQVTGEYRNLKRKEKNIVIRYNNKLYSMYEEGERWMEEEIPESTIYEGERLLVAQQKEEYFLAENIRKESIKKEQQERVRKESVFDERKERRVLIPQEPTLNQEEQVVTLLFRCPNGNRMTRNFRRVEKIELIYCWVETNEQIEFEDEVERKFELLQGYPPVKIENTGQEIQTIIEGGERVNIMIRQL